MIPQLTISLSPQGELVTELPGLNGSRRKINLGINQKSNLAIAYATQILREISNLSGDTTAITDATKATELLNSLQSKMKSAADAANQISNLLDEDNLTTDIIFRILNGQQTNKNQIGEDGNPTEQQVKHWQKHGHMEDGKIIPKNSFSDPSCAHCKAEGRFEKGYNREDTRKLSGLTEHEALRLGLISRGYIANKNNPEIFSKKNMGNLRLTPNCKIIDHKQIEISRENKNDILKDGKIYASRHGFVKHSPIKTKSVTVKHIKKMVKETQIERLTRNPVILPL